MATLQQITGGGVFTAKNISDLNDNFAAISQPDIWVRPQAAVAGANGTYAKPFGTMAAANPYLRTGMIVGLQGVLLEEYSSARVNDITLLGMGNLPRQATTSGVPNGGGATWLSPTSGTGALLQPNGQGWRIQNIFFNCSATAAPAIKLVNAGDPPTSNCSEKTSIVGCFITGTDDGIGATDLPNNVLIDGCMIFSCSGSGDIGISSATGAGIGTLNSWVIQNCDFVGNANHIIAPFTGSVIRNNRFSYIYNGVTTTTQVTLTSGANNSVYNNHFDIPYATNGLAAMFAGGTNDRWGPNQFSDAIATTIFSFGVPTS